MGIFRTMKLGGLFWDGAKLSEPWVQLGQVLADPDRYDDLTQSEKAQIITLSELFLDFEKSFSLYFEGTIKSQEDRACKFLVMFAAVLFGIDGIECDANDVRKLAQGYWGSMEDEPTSFRKYNSPNIKKVKQLIAEFRELKL
jgi:hypothetical protein